MILLILNLAVGYFFFLQQTHFDIIQNYGVRRGVMQRMNLFVSMNHDIPDCAWGHSGRVAA